MQPEQGFEDTSRDANTAFHNSLQVSMTDSVFARQSEGLHNREERPHDNESPGGSNANRQLQKGRWRQG